MNMEGGPRWTQNGIAKWMSIFHGWWISMRTRASRHIFGESQTSEHRRGDFPKLYLPNLTKLCVGPRRVFGHLLSDPHHLSHFFFPSVNMRLLAMMFGRKISSARCRKQQVQQVCLCYFFPRPMLFLVKKVLSSLFQAFYASLGFFDANSIS